MVEMVQVVVEVVDCSLRIQPVELPHREMWVLDRQMYLTMVAAEVVLVVLVHQEVLTILAVQEELVC